MHNTELMHNTDDQFEKSVVQFLSIAGEVAGSGFLTAQSKIITCEHVVVAAYGGYEPPLDTIFVVRFPFCEDGEAAGKLEYLSAFDDLCILAVSSRLPTSARPLGISIGGRRINRQVRMLGFPVAGPDGGVFGDGVVRGITKAGNQVLLQVGDSQEVTRGFSGSPVVDQETGLAIGILSRVAQIDDLGRGAFTNWVVPAERIVAACPGLDVESLCPYKGLQSFRKQDASLFFGRQAVLSRLIDKMAESRNFVALLGPSGSGKSSLINAGLLPALDAQSPIRNERWGQVVIYPGGDPYRQLAAAGLRQADRSLEESVREWLDSMPEYDRLCLVVDQFEELLTQSPITVRDRFLAEVHSAGESIPRLYVIVVMRIDFFSQLSAASEPMMERVEKSMVRIPERLTRSDLLDIVERPAAEIGVRIDRALALTIVNDVLESGRADAPTSTLPLLEFALTKMWPQLSKRRLSEEDFFERGCVLGALSAYCDQVIETLTQSKRDIARIILTSLVNPAKGLRLRKGGEEGNENETFAPATSRQRSVQQLFESIPNSESRAKDIEDVLDELVGTRLIETTSEDNLQVGVDQPPVKPLTVVRLGHESLITAWGTLQDWLEADYVFLAWERPVRERAEEWRAQGSANSLLREEEIAEATNWRSNRELPRTIDRFVTASAVAINRRKRRRRLTIVIVALLVASVAGVGFVSLQQNAEARTQATIAKGNSLAGQSRPLLASRPDTAQLLASQSLISASTSETWSAATAALESAFNKSRVLQTPDSPFLASSNGRSFAFDRTQDFDSASLSVRERRAELWDLQTEQLLLTLPSDETVKGFSRDGTRLLSQQSTYDPNAGAFLTGNIRIRDSLSGHLVVALPASSVTEDDVVAFAPDLGALVALANNGSGRLIDSRSPSVTSTTFDHGLPSVDIATFSNSGRSFAAFSVLTRTIRVFDSEGKGLLQEVRLPDDAFSQDSFYGRPTITFNLDDTAILLSGEYDPNGILINLGLSTPTTLVGSGRSDSTTFSPDGKLLAVGRGYCDADTPRGSNQPETCSVDLWDVSTGSLIRSFEDSQMIEGAAGNSSAIFSPDGRLIATTEAADNDVVSVWDTNSGQRRARLEDHLRRVNAVAFRAQGTELLTASNDGTLRIWSIDRAVSTATLSSGDGRVQDFFLTNDELKILSTASSGYDLQVRVWEAIATNQESPAQLESTETEVDFIRSSRDGSILVTSGVDQKVRIWDAATGRMIYEVGGFAARVRVLALSPDGRYLAWPTDGNAVRLWDVQKRKAAGIFRGHSDWIYSLAFSEDSSRLASAGSDDRIRIWGVDNREELTSTEQREGIIDALAFSPDGSQLASGNRSHVTNLWRTDDGTQVGPYLGGHTDDVKSVAFSPNGQSLATASLDGTVRIWDVSGMALTRTLSAHTDSIFAITFSSDGTLLVSASDDGEVRLWSVNDYDVTAPLRGEGGFVRSAAFIGTSNRIVSANWASVVRLWPEPSSWIELLCERAGRNFTLTEWLRYIGPDRAYMRTCSDWPSGRGAPADAEVEEYPSSP